MPFTFAQYNRVKRRWEYTTGFAPWYRQTPAGIETQIFPANAETAPFSPAY